MERFSWFIRQAPCNYKVLKSERRRQKRKKQRDGSVRSTQPNVAGFGDGGEGQVKECPRSLEGRKGKEIGSPSEPPQAAY